MERRATGHTGLTWITVISGELALTAGTSFGLSGTVSNLTQRISSSLVLPGSQSSGTATFWRNTGMGSYWLDAAAEIKGNRIRGSLSCRNNHPAPTNGGHHSTVPGHRRGQCAAAAGL